METSHIPFAAFLTTAFDRGDYATDDVIAIVLPLFRQVLAFHEDGLVAPFERPDTLFLADRHLEMEEIFAHPQLAALSRIQAPPQHPAYLPGYQCFEHIWGHHDPQTDIFCLGLVLSSITLGLDLYKAGDLQLFTRIRPNPTLYKERIHPTIARLITEMTELDRSRRTQDLYEVIRRLEFYRDYDPEKRTDLSQVPGWVTTALHERSSFILNKLRNRLFDTSRRNRLLYYRLNMRFVNLSISSVPLVLHHQSIRPELLFTWNSELAEKISGAGEIVLNKYLRFEDHDYLPSSLDRVRLESRHALQEYGFSQLKLVIAFLNWHNLKEDRTERIQSPLLLVPVELKKNKKPKEDHYVMKVLDNTAEVNPVLAGQLKDLYGIRLPDFIDLEEMSPQQFQQLLKTQIEEANQGIELQYIDKPDIPLIHQEATQTVSNHHGKRLRRQPGFQAQHDKPRDPEISPQHIESGNSPLEFLINEDPNKLVNEDPNKGDAQMATGDPSPGPLTDTNPREKEPYEPAQTESNPYKWDFDVCNMVLGNFNYKKMSLVRDYNQVIDQQLQHHTFDDLFSDSPRPFHTHSFDPNRPDDWFHVITADPAQTKAILQSRAGYSYIIQGPPGTGKSQTITNLIADFVARGKNILFVCEKRAALDVVYHRLKQNGLDELCCYIHDSQGDKREFIKDLKATYENFTGNRSDLGSIRAKRQALLEKMNGNIEMIKDFHATSLVEKTETGIPVRKLIERIIECRQYLVTISAKEEELLPSYKKWKDAGPVITGLAEALEDAGSDPVFSAHPFSRIADHIFMADNPHGLLDGYLQQAQNGLQELENVIRENKIAQEHVQLLDSVKNLVQFAVVLYPLALTGNLSLADPTRPEAQEFERQYRQYREKQEVYRQAMQKNIHWTQKFSEQDLLNSLPIALKNEGTFSSFLHGNWQKLKKQLHAGYDFSQHAVRPSYTSILELLQAEYEADRQQAQSRRELQDRYHVDNIDTTWLSIEVLHHKRGDKVLNYVLQHPEAPSLISALQTLHQPLHEVESSLRRCLHDPVAGDLASIRDDLQNIQLNGEILRDLLPALRSFTGLPAEVKDALRHLALSPIQAEAAIARKALHQLYQSNRGFAGIEGQAIEKAVQQLGDSYTVLQRLNADLIRAYVRERFLQQVDLANMASSQLNDEQKKFKKTYNEGRKILENEFGKTMRYKSIRELSARESGLVLKDIKPVWLMSPYSVSDSLPLDSDHFDVVIFDEASQITLEEGVPALYRSRQTIIVGDEKQMPPTDFFAVQSKDRDRDDLEGPGNMDDLDDDEWLSDDADSLLAQGTRKLNSALLSWHYRSHYETLISFSNHAFYEGALLTIPDKTIHHKGKPPIEIARNEDAVRLADTLFDRSISFHFHTASVYEKRSNPAEAAYIAHLVRELLRRNTQESIGIVAFSQEQQHTIEFALDELAAQDTIFGQKLEEAFNRTENDQFTGLIIKNLENIQGDERDIIIMSVCYGFDSRRRMLMNFGPVNKRGGEKRLNVLFSRAKKHMAVISSIRYPDITNEYNEGANYLRRFLHYAERISLGDMEPARMILDGLALRKEDAPSVLQTTLIAQQISEQVRHMGFEVSEQVGQSGFKCSLAIKAKPEDEEYTLGILIDDDRHYQNKNLVEQYYQRPAILRNFGWRIISVFAKDWLHQPQKVIERIRKEMQSAILDGSPATPLHGGNTGNLDEGTGRPGQFQEYEGEWLRYEDAQHNKFWEAAANGNKLIIRWGRTGAKGQIQVKTFPDAAAAEKEMEKLVKEKLGSGYAKN